MNSVKINCFGMHVNEDKQIFNLQINVYLLPGLVFSYDVTEETLSNVQFLGTVTRLSERSSLSNFRPFLKAGCSPILVLVSGDRQR